MKSCGTSLSISAVISVASLVHHSILQSIALLDEAGLAFSHSPLLRENNCGQVGALGGFRVKELAHSEYLSCSIVLPVISHFFPIMSKEKPAL